MKKSIFNLAIICLLFCCKDNRKNDDNKILGDEVVTFIVDDFPNGYDYNNSLYISGDFEGWSGGREQFKLKKVGRQYSISIPKYREVISFKFTLGSWDNVECAQNGNPLENRIYFYSKLKDTVKVSINKWSAPSFINKRSTSAENVQIFDNNFDIPQLKRERKISVYLPPNYKVSNERYPVLYILDGQNVFDESKSYSGEWEVDETLNRIYEETGFGLIVVAIDHGGDKRLNEYSAWDNEKYGKGEGEDLLKFLTQTLKPKIDGAFRTNIDAPSTAIMGSSLGGLFAHYAAFKAPDVYGKAGVFSPSFWYSESCYEFTKKANSDMSNSRIYYLIGDKEGKDVVSNMTKMIQLIKSNGFPEENVVERIVPNGTHSETLWKAEFEQAIEWLFNIK